MNPKSIPKRISSWVLLCFASFFLAVTAFGQIVVPNNTPITIRDNNTADPYPATIRVTGYTGVVEKVVVRLNDITHAYPDDIDILLLAPSGKQVVLMSDAGGQTNLDNVDLEFDFFPMPPPLPDEAQLVSGRYYPSNYAPTDSWPSAPAPSTVNIEDLAGDNANGDWSLFVVDDRAVDDGTIRSWSLEFWMTPVIGVTNAGSNVVTDEDVDAKVQVFVSDTDTPISQLQLSSSFDSSIVKGVSFAAKTGNQFEATIDLVDNRSTSSTPVTLSVFDGSATHSVVVNLKVNAVNDAPTVAVQPNATTISRGGISTNLTVVVNDVDTDTNTLQLFAVSDNNDIVSGTDVYFVGGISGPRTLKVASNGRAVGTAHLTVYVVDASGSPSLTNSTPLTVTVNDVAHRVAANAASISVDNSQVISTNTVADVKGLIGEIEVVLLDVEHQTPSDLSVLLVGPQGQSVVLMRNAGGSNPITNRWLKFDDDATTSLTAATIVTSTNDPTDLGAGDIGGAAPAAPYGADLSVFENTDPNGKWRLFVTDANGNAGGQINGGWVLHIYPRPTIQTIAAQTLNEGTAGSPAGFIPITAGVTNSVSVRVDFADQDGSVTNITASIVSPQPSTNTSTTIVTIRNPSINVAAGAAGADASATFVIETRGDLFGTNQIQVIVTDNSGKFTSTNYFNVVVTPINDAPFQEVIQKQITTSGEPIGPIVFFTYDNETLPQTLVATVTGDNAALLPPGSIVVTNLSANQRGILIFPAGVSLSQASARITVTVTDNGEGSSGAPQVLSSQQSFNLTVDPPASPLIEQRRQIDIADNTNAVQYPSQIFVTNLVGQIAEVKVTLYGLTHPNPDDLQILLAGPTGTNIVLLSDVGDNLALTNAIIVFADDATNSLPDEDRIFSGVYLPTDAEGTGDFPYPPVGTPSPSPNATSLSAYTNTTAEGNWSLYVYDAAASDKGGAITAWTLSIRTRPQLAVITNQITEEDVTKFFRVSLGTLQPGVAYGTSSSTNIPGGQEGVVKSVTLERSGDSLNVTIVPIPDHFGTNQITINVTDPDGFVTTRTFDFIVTPRADAPRISDISNKNTGAGMPIDIAFTVSDAPFESTPAQISTSVAVDRPELVAEMGISGTGASRTLRIVPAGFLTGTLNVTITARDSSGTESTEPFVLEIGRSVGGTDSRPITINPFGPSSAYPSTIEVQNIQGRVSRARVILDGFSHTFPDDVDVLLVPPGVTSSSALRPVLLMADAGGGNPVSDLRLTFAQTGVALPDETALQDDTIYAPNNYPDGQGGTDEFGLNLGAFTTDLTTLSGINPNGTWSLYVRDDTTAEAGQIARGWILILETGPTFVETTLDTSTAEDTSRQIVFTVADEDSEATELSVTYAINDSPPFHAGLLTGPGSNITLTTNKYTYTLTVLPTANRPSGTTPETNRITLTVTDETSASRNLAFNFVVTPVDDLPVVGTATNTVTVAEDTTFTIDFTVSDVDSTLRTNDVRVTSSNQNLIPDANIKVAPVQPATYGPGVTGTVTVTVTPASNANTNIASAGGPAVLTFSIRDQNGASSRTPVSTAVTVHVTPVNDNPTISNIQNVGIEVGQSSTVNFTVGDRPDETRSRDLVVTWTSSNESVIPVSNIVPGGNDQNRTLTITALNVTGSSVITVRVTDENGGFSEDQFTVNVSPSPIRTYANTAPIQIRDNNSALPYPSTIDLGSVTGVVHSITVTLDGFGHAAPDDVDILLVNRTTGTNVLIMSDAGGSNVVSGLRLSFSNTATAPLPDDSPLSSGTYGVSNYRGIEGDVDVFPNTGTPPPPGTGRSTRITDFVGKSANGPWDLYVIDDRQNDAGEIQFGWSLSIVTTPEISPSASTVNFPEDTPTTVVLTINDPVVDPGALEFSFALQNSSGQNASLLDVDNIRLDRSNPNAVIAELRPNANQFGTNNLTVTVTRPTDRVSQSTMLRLNVTPVDDPLVFEAVADRSSNEDEQVQVAVTISDVDNPARNTIWLEVQSSNNSIVQTGSSSTNILINNVRTNLLKGLPSNPVMVTLVPRTNSNGTVTITLVATESGANPVSEPFVLTVNSVNDLPTISVPAHQTLVEAGFATTNISFTVADVESASLTVTGQSSNTNVVRDADIVVTPASAAQASRTVQITTQPSVTDSTTINLIVEDANGGRATNQFVLSTTLPRERTYTNSTAITINDNNAGSPYPSTILVPRTGESEFVGPISKVTARLSGFAHSYPSDVDVLLVSPQGQKVILMSDAGSGNPVTGLNLRFDQSASSAIPQAGPLTSGSFRPANYQDNSTDPFSTVGATPAPAGPYAETMSAFNGVSPNGTWSLYVLDDTTSDSGQIVNGWILGITTEPLVTLSTNLLGMFEDSPSTLTLTVQDENFGTTEPVITVSTADASLVPANRIKVERTSTTTWQVTVTGADNAFGTNATLITVNVSYAPNQSVSRVFGVSIQERNDEPVITSGFTNIVGGTLVNNVARIPAGGVARLTGFNYVDVETDKNNLILTNEVSVSSVFPKENVIMTGNDVRIFTQGAAFGTNVVTLIVRDPRGGEARTNITVIVEAPLAPLFASTDGTIGLPPGGSATNNYPSTIEVRGLGTNVTRVVVTLTGVTHNFPDDLDILLVGPKGQRAVVMSDAGGSGALSNARLTFDDSAASLVPDNSQIDEFGTYKPSNYDGADQFPPLTDGPASHTPLSIFGGTDPNGTWSLYVRDDQSPDAGSIGGWLLEIETTTPTISEIPDFVMNEDTTASLPFRVRAGGATAAQIVTTAAVTDGAALFDSLPITGADGLDRAVVLTPRQNAFGTNVITVTVTNTVNGEVATDSFTVVVNNINDAPIVSGLTDTSTEANRDLPIEFAVIDVDGDTLTVTAVSSNPGAGTVTEVTGTSSVRRLTFVPNRDWTQVTNTLVTVSVTDGTVTTLASFTVTVNAPLAPVIAPIANTNVLEDAQNIQIPIMVASASNITLQVTARTLDTTIVSAVAVATGSTSSDRILVVTLVPNAFGNAPIEVVATDVYGSATNTFILGVISVPDAPVFGPIADIQTTEDTSVEIVLPITDADTALSDLVLSSSISNPNLIASLSYTVTAESILARINLVPNASGFSAISITVSDNNSPAQTRAFGITVSPVADLPVLDPILPNPLIVNEDAVVTVPLTITDADTAIDALVLTGTSSNSNLVSGITFTTTSSNAVANIALVTNAFGTATVTISVSEGTNVSSQSFELQVIEEIEPPELGPITDVSVNENTTVIIPLNVTDLDDALTNLTFFYATTNGTALVQDLRFVFANNTVAAEITLRPNTGGNERITISVSDGNGVDREAFNLSVALVNDPVEIGPIADVTTSGPTVAVEFTVSDELAASQLTYFWANSSNLVSNIQFTPTSATTVRADITLAANRTGTDRLTISVSDGESTSRRSFNVTVTVAGPPTIAIARGANNTVVLNVTGAVGSTVVIEGSAGLVTWSQFQTVTLDANGQGQVQVGSTGHHRFFRARYR